MCGQANGDIFSLSILGVGGSLTLYTTQSDRGLQEDVIACGFYALSSPIECLAFNNDYLALGGCEQIAVYQWHFLGEF